MQCALRGRYQPAGVSAKRFPGGHLNQNQPMRVLILSGKGFDNAKLHICHKLLVIYGYWEIPTGRFRQLMWFL